MSSWPSANSRSAPPWRVRARRARRRCQGDRSSQWSMRSASLKGPVLRVVRARGYEVSWATRPVTSAPSVLVTEGAVTRLGARTELMNSLP